MGEGKAVGARVRSGQTAAATDSRQAPVSRWRSLGLPWLIGVVVIPLLIAAIGYGELDGSRSASSGALATLGPSGKRGAPKMNLAPLSIVRNANDITLTGDFPDDSAKAILLKTLKGSLPSGVNIVDQIQLNPNIDALDFSHAGPIFKDSGSITDFTFTVNTDTITLAGTAGSQDQKNTIEREVKHTWSHLNVVDNLAVNSSTAPAAPPVSPSPAPCTDLQKAVDAVTGGPVTFDTDGITLTPADQQILTQVADKLKACPNAHATIDGYADNSGTDAINVPLSTQRAQAVADFLVAHGVAGDQLVVKGLGSIDPVDSNETADGRAKNRRVQIVVS
jgi:peptidoglycan-binding protein ArfA